MTYNIASQEILDILCQHPSWSDKFVFGLSSTSRQLRLLVARNIRAVDIAFEPKFVLSGLEVGFQLHSCILEAPNLVRIKLHMAYTSFTNYSSNYITLCATDLAQLTCCKNLRHFEFVMLNTQNALPDKTFHTVQKKLEGFSDMDIATVWPNLETLVWKIVSNGRDHGVTPNILRLPKSCTVLETSLDTSLFDKIPDSVTDLNINCSDIWQSISRMTMSQAFQSGNLLSFGTNLPIVYANHILPYLPVSLTCLKLCHGVVHFQKDCDNVVVHLTRLSNLSHLDLGEPILLASHLHRFKNIFVRLKKLVMTIYPPIYVNGRPCTKRHAIRYLELSKKLKAIGMSSTQFYIN